MTELATDVLRPDSARCRFGRPSPSRGFGRGSERPRRVRLCWLAALLALLAPTSVALSQQEPLGSLGRAVPDRSQFFAHWRYPAASPVSAFFRKISDSDLISAAFALLTRDLAKAERAEANHAFRKLARHISDPAWSELISLEGVVAVRVALPIEGVGLFRVHRDARERHWRALRDLIDGLRSFAPEALRIEANNDVGQDRRQVALAMPGVPWRLVLAQRGDVLALGLTVTLLDETLARLEAEPAAADSREGATTEGGSGEEGSADDGDRKESRGQNALPSTAQAAFAALPEVSGKTCARIYLDAAGCASFLEAILAAAKRAPQDAHRRGVLSFLGWVVRELGLLRHIAIVLAHGNDGWEANTRVQFGVENEGLLEAAVARATPVAAPGTWVPAAAEHFVATGGVAWDEVLAGLKHRVRETLPRGRALVEDWEARRPLGFDLEGDLLSWFDGGLGVVALPRGDRQDFIVVVRSRNRQAAEEFRTIALSSLRRVLASRGQALHIETVEEDGTLQAIHCDAVPEWRVFCGVAEEALVVGTSREALSHLAATYHRGAPGVSDTHFGPSLRLPDGPLLKVWSINAGTLAHGTAEFLGRLSLFFSAFSAEPSVQVGANGTGSATARGHLGGVLSRAAVFLRSLPGDVRHGGWARYRADQHCLEVRQCVVFRGVPPGDG